MAIKDKLMLVKHLVDYAKQNKSWFIIPLIIFIVLFGMVLVFAQGSIFAPFIYTLF